MQQRRRLHPATTAASALGPKKKQLTPKPNVLQMKKKVVDPPADKSTKKKKGKSPTIEALAAGPPTSVWGITNEPQSRQTKPEQKNMSTLPVKTPSWHCGTLSGSLDDRLHQEIVDYARYTRAIVSEMAVHIEKTIDLVRASVRKLWPDATVETYGSYSTGIWLPSSDIDLVILGTSDDASSHLKCLAASLKHEKWVESILLVESAKVPLLKLVSTDSSVPIDITFETANTHSGLLARDLIKCLVDELPELYPLAIVFKQLLRERGLNDAYTGGLSSYSIVLMIVHFAQLWRAGSNAFNAALVYASGSLPTEAISIDMSREPKLKQESPKKKPNPLSDKSAQPPLLKPVAGTSPPAAPLPKSYAAVLEPTKNSVMSYAAAAVGPVPPITYATMAAKEASLSLPSHHKTADDHHDIVSESSSQADTEDTSADEACDDETVRVVCLGAHARQLLEFFGCVFDYRKSGLSIRNGGFIYRLRDMTDSTMHGLHLRLVVEDPIHPDRNVSAASFAFQKVVALFEDAYFALEYFRPTRFTPTPLSVLLSCSGHRGTHRRYVQAAVGGDTATTGDEEDDDRDD
ncbi:hypothetical protein H257_03008 [Aphanomyces astaci]|uniref:Polymerase nucleotidyl transferase domain-containing protein n=2 Tax=Aphanomyces astaci TaxID=112090 RepID=W4GZU8_APHAT|nr:hypothetical protein H257_03008 [Aphanomyces astaci]ETV85172.1 hypothetical protein H257_03008 [Aphanomyces astaci]|eukprot:XP_009825190.1 hypothetical protein H257_03008 [Aphanomyces astaci]